MALQSSRQAPESPAFPKRGEVWMMHLNPITPGDKHLPRPVVIVSTNARNRHWDSVIVVPCSSNLENPNPKFHKALPGGEGGISKDCHARCDLISNIQKSCLDR